MNSSHYLVLFLMTSVALVEFGVEAENGPEIQEWRRIRENTNRGKLKRGICDSIITFVEWDNLKFEKVKVMFEDALEHIAMVSRLVSEMKDKVGPELFDAYYTNSAMLVLKISNKYRKLVDDFEYGRRQKWDEKRMQSLVEEAALIACASIKGAMLSEKTMRRAAANVNKWKN